MTLTFESPEPEAAENSRVTPVTQDFCPIAETLAAEEEVAQSLLELKECTRVGGTELQQLEAELQKASKEDACLQARL